LIRFAQDCSQRYGEEVNAFEIVLLTKTEYLEREAGTNPVLTGAGQMALGSRWNRHGMHHVDLHRLDTGQWIASVDGYRKWLKVRMEY
jgi:hypothetical protein